MPTTKNTAQIQVGEHLFLFQRKEETVGIPVKYRNATCKGKYNPRNAE